MRAAGAVLLGPNCLGVADLGADLHLGWDPFPRGQLGVISQSGNLALELAVLAVERDLGFSRFASLGNQADIEIGDLIDALAAHPDTRAIAIYCEDFKDGRAFAAAAEEAVRAGTPVYLLAGGRSDASARAAASHTGALVSGHGAIDAACEAAGIRTVTTQVELIDLAQAALAPVPLVGRRIAVFGDGGGHGVIAADVATDVGLEVPALSAALQARLAPELPATASVGNPVDIAGASDDWLGVFARLTGTLLGSDEARRRAPHGLLRRLLHDGRGVRRGRGGRRARDRRGRRRDGQAARGPHDLPARRRSAVLRAAGVPVYGDIGAAAAALADLHARTRPPGGVPALPPAAAPVTATGYLEDRAALAAAGVPLGPVRRAATLAEAHAAADELGFPLVLKALGLLHKSDAGGVVVGIRDAAALERAFADVMNRLAPPAVAIEQMAPLADGVELIVGCVRDPRFGPIAMLGLGGIYAEAPCATSRSASRRSTRMRPSASCAACAAPASSPARAGARRSTSPRRRARPRRSRFAAAPPRCTRSRSTRCSCCRRARSASTRGSSSADRRGRSPAPSNRLRSHVLGAVDAQVAIGEGQVEQVAVGGRGRAAPAWKWWQVRQLRLTVMTPACWRRAISARRTRSAVARSSALVPPAGEERREARRRRARRASRRPP